MTLSLSLCIYIYIPGTQYVLTPILIWNSLVLQGLTFQNRGRWGSRHIHIYIYLHIHVHQNICIVPTIYMYTYIYILCKFEVPGLTNHSKATFCLAATCFALAIMYSMHPLKWRLSTCRVVFHSGQAGMSAAHELSKLGARFVSFAFSFLDGWGMMCHVVCKFGCMFIKWLPVDYRFTAVT